MEPAKHLGSEAEGKAWLDAAAQVYAQRVGISLSSGGSGSSAGGSSGGAVMNSVEFLKFGCNAGGCGCGRGVIQPPPPPPQCGTSFLGT